MTMRLLNKTAIVTGSSSGIGRAIALAYAREGARLVCADLTPYPRLPTKHRPSASPNEEKNEREKEEDEDAVSTHELIANSGGAAVFVKTDAGEAGDMRALVEKAVEAFGRVDVMVNNAGISAESRTPAVLHETDDGMWDLTMKVNVKSVFLGCKYALAQMLKQEPHESGDRGWIVNLSSIYGIVAGQDNPSYCASKGAVSNLTRQAALDYAKHRIHVNALCPGYVQTAIYAETTANMIPAETLERRHPFNGPGFPADIAKMAVVLASDDASWVTGVCLPVDGGYTAR